VAEYQGEGGMSERDSEIGLHRVRWIEEFHASIMRCNVVDLAVGIVIGAAFTALVNSYVKDILSLGAGADGILQP
jgi:large conductance mechanosensitive channel